ncbi:MAG: FAD:protein FMN transferase [Bacteroidales bacterium]|nr:FAD:protein FMN transferase [Bacteroidales bacterium]
MTIRTNILAAMVLSIAIITSCNEKTGYIQLTGYAQGDVYSVKLNTAGVNVPQGRIRASVDSILTLIDTTLSGYNKGSMLSRFNRGETITPNSIFIEIYGISRDFYELSDGAFDIAAGPIYNAWGFGFTTDSLPSRELIDSLLAVSGMDRLKRDIRTAIAPDGTLSPADLLLKGEGPLPVLNYNAIAQGYTSDLIARYLTNIGVTDMLVDIGEIYCSGHNPFGAPWSIGIDRPTDGNNDPGADLTGIWDSEGASCGIVTSGNYRKFYIKDGHKYSHSIDPRTGFPTESPLLSATVVARDATTADAVATWCMVVGLDEARALIRRRQDMEAYLIYDDEGTMKEWISPGFNIKKE